MSCTLKDKIGQISTVMLLFAVGIASAQTFTPIGDPENDKRAWLVDQSLPTAVNAFPPNTIMSGVLWPALVQLNNFRRGYPILAGVDSCANQPDNAVTITGASESGHAESGLKNHSTGFKVDLRVNNRCSADPITDALSSYIIGVAPAQGIRNDSNGGVARTQTSTNIGFNGFVFALEYPLNTFPTNTQKPFTRDLIHWDVLSSYNGLCFGLPLCVSSISLTVKVGAFVPISPRPAAYDTSFNEIPTQPFMFQYDFPNDPGQTLAAIDSTGLATGAIGNVIGVGEGSSLLQVSQGNGPNYLGYVFVQVNPPDPPDGGGVCLGSDQSQWSNCWHWDRSSNSWQWYPNMSTTSTPNPPNPPPPPFGVCPSGPQTTLVPCWQWDPTANGGRGAWVFVPPGGGTSDDETSPTINPAQSVDPNAISGPAGTGAAQYITAASPLGYTVFFENEPTATAAAAQVVVTDQVDTTRFDLSTLTLGPITFPGFSGITPPSVPLQSLGGFSTQVSLPTTNLLVNVSASLNSVTGLLTWTLRAIDPNTGLPPADPSLGILPPGGNGFVSFSARLKPSLATGTVVNDQASVIFDVNAPILTAVWSNTLDITAPTSRVSALPSTESSASFTVGWSGTDVGSGIQKYTIYVSDSGGAFAPWLTQSASTSAKFIGLIGHSYSFYSIATDFAGNTESAKTSADTSTIVTVTCAANATGSIAMTRGGFRLNNGTQQFVQTVTLQEYFG